MTSWETLSPTDLARFIEVPEKTLAYWRYAGSGPKHFKIGKHVRYRVTDVEEWLSQQYEAAKA